MEGKKIICKDESYKVMGILFKIHRELGSICKEKNYCDAIETLCIKENIPYRREVELKMPFDGGLLSGFRADFILFDSIIIEAKATYMIKYEFIRQTSRYLKATNLPLGIVVNFKQKSLEYKRIVNKECSNLDTYLS